MASLAPKIQSEETDSSSRGIWRFFANPIVGFLGTLASIVSVPLAIYLFFESNVTRELRYLVNPARAVVVHAGQTSRLAVSLDGTPVKYDISAAQVAFWNEGHAPIRPDNMLQQLVIKTSPSTPIIDVSIRKRSRDVVKIDLDRSRLASGELSVHWNILEYHDGGVIQVIYLGGVNTPVTAKATVEGQGGLSNKSAKRFHPGSSTAMLAGFLFLLIAYYVSGHKHPRLFSILAIATVIVTNILVIIIDVYILSGNTGPPFGFN